MSTARRGSSSSWRSRSAEDFTEELKKITAPVLVMHGDDDQIVPYADSGPLSAALVQNGTLKRYKGFPHGMPTAQAETIDADLLAVLTTRQRGGCASVPKGE
jgi:non-heme chloroperoxidase